MRTKTFVAAAVTISLAGLTFPVVARNLIKTDEPDLHRYDLGIRMAASWVDHPSTLRQMVQLAEAVVVVTAGEASPGRIVRTNVEGDPGLEFELVNFRVDQVIKGELSALITLERVAQLQGGRRVILGVDGGSYVAGRSYLMFVRRQVDSPYYILINDEGRYFIDTTGRLETRGEGNVANTLRGLPLAAALGLIRQALNAR